MYKYIEESPEVIFRYWKNDIPDSIPFNLDELEEPEIKDENYVPSDFFDVDLDI